MRKPLSPEAFNEILAEYFVLNGEITSQSRLVEDLGLDSLQLYEVVLLLEDVADCEIPEGLIESLATVGDVYDTYRMYVERSRTEADPA